MSSNDVKVGDFVIAKAQGVSGSAFKRGEDIRCEVRKLPTVVTGLGKGLYTLAPPPNYYPNYIVGGRIIMRARDEFELEKPTDAELAEQARVGRKAVIELQKRGYIIELKTSTGKWALGTSRNNEIRFRIPKVTEIVVKSPEVIL